MENIQPWCISRQLLWGHQVPAWYGPDGKVFVCETEDEAKEMANEHYKENIKLHQDSDVLDTWFSSALWPFSVMGWPEETLELEKFYPTSALVTGFDIIFFGLLDDDGFVSDEQGSVKDVYVHALVRDEKECQNLAAM